MKITLKAGKQSNYEITLTVPQDSLDTYKENALKNFQKEMSVQGFRKGHVPLDMVEKKVSPEYLSMGIFEEVVHQGTKKLIEDNKDKRFIGTIYDLKREDKGDDMVVTFKLDVFPEVALTNSNWKTVKMWTIDSSATPEELEQTIANLRKQYAQYKDADEVNAETIFKFTFTFHDATGNQVDKGVAYIGPEDFAEFSSLQAPFVGKKNNDTIALPYDTNTLPPVLHSRHQGEAPVQEIKGTISDIKYMELPELTPENIQKFFGNEKITSLDELKKELTTLIEKQKYETMLMQTVDAYLQEIGSSFTLAVPQTLINEEVKSRMKNLQERMWGEEGLKKYFERMGEEKANAMKQEIKDAAQVSLSKFFVLKALATELGIEEKNLDWQTPLAVETLVFDAVNNLK